MAYIDDLNRPQLKLVKNIVFPRIFAFIFLETCLSHRYCATKLIFKFIMMGGLHIYFELF